MIARREHRHLQSDNSSNNPVCLVGGCGLCSDTSATKCIKCSSSNMYLSVRRGQTTCVSVGENCKSHNPQTKACTSCPMQYELVSANGTFYCDLATENFLNYFATGFGSFVVLVIVGVLILQFKTRVPKHAIPQRRGRENTALRRDKTMRQNQQKDILKQAPYKDNLSKDDIRVQPELAVLTLQGLAENGFQGPLCC